MKYNYVIFDLDGTLLDTSEGIMNGVSYTANVLQIPELTIDQKKSFIGPPLVNSFIREFNLNENEAKKAVGIYRERYRIKGLYEAKQYTNIKSILKSLTDKGYKTAVATLKRDDLANEIIRHFNLSQYFDLIKGIDEHDTYSKADIILMCLKEIKENDLSKVVLIGDSSYDAEGAAEVGIDFIAVTYGFGYKNKQEANQNKNVFVAESVDNIREYLNV